MGKRARRELVKARKKINREAVECFGRSQPKPQWFYDMMHPLGGTPGSIRRIRKSKEKPVREMWLRKDEKDSANIPHVDPRFIAKPGYVRENRRIQYDRDDNNDSLPYLEEYDENVGAPVPRRLLDRPSFYSPVHTPQRPITPPRFTAEGYYDIAPRY